MNDKQIIKENKKSATNGNFATQNEVKTREMGLTEKFKKKFYNNAKQNPIFNFLFDYLDISRRDEENLRIEDRVYYNLNKIAVKYNLSVRDFDKLTDDFCFLQDFILSLVSECPNLTITLTKNTK